MIFLPVFFFFGKNINIIPTNAGLGLYILNADANFIRKKINIMCPDNQGVKSEASFLKYSQRSNALRLTIRNPKSGKSSEAIFIPKKLADRLKDYIRARGIGGDQRIFLISYTAARVMARKAGTSVRVHLRPHDLRPHAATYTSRSGVPVKIVSKVILRHANLSITQRYLKKVSDVEALRWIENLYGS
jgi:integrase